MKKNFDKQFTPNEVAQLIYKNYRLHVLARNREFIPDEFTQNSILKVAEYLSDRHSSRFGILLCGTCGNGKTTMMHAIADYLKYIISHDLVYIDSYQKNNTPVQILTAKDIIKRAKEGRYYQELKQREYLLIDDLGYEPCEIMEYGTIITPVVDLLENRYSLMKYTIISSNLSPKELSSKYGERLADRFREMLFKISFTHPSYRK
jgi:DNA replication protein DnaC